MTKTKPKRRAAYSLADLAAEVDALEARVAKLEGATPPSVTDSYDPGSGELEVDVNPDGRSTP